MFVGHAEFAGGRLSAHENSYAFTRQSLSTTYGRA